MLEGLEAFAWWDRQCVRLGFFGRDKRRRHEYELRPSGVLLPHEDASGERDSD